MPRSLFAEAIPRLIEIGWVEEINHYNSSVYEKSHESADKSHVSASRSQGTDYGMEWNGMEEKGMEEKGMEKKEDVVRTTSREADASPANRKNRIPSADIDSVVQHYQGYHPQAKPGRKERAKIADRIRDGYSADELKAAIDGCHQSPFHCGENERGKKYQALDLIMRDSDHVVQFIETLERAGPRLSEKNQRTLRAAQAYVRKRREQKSD